MNYNLLKYCWIPILLFFFNGYSYAQKNNHAATDSSIAPAVEDPVNNDYENVADTLIIKSVFENANDSILKWKQSREFGYMAYLDSLLRKKTDIRMDSTSGTDPNSFLNSFPVRIFFWIMAIFFIGFILFKLFFTGGLFAKGDAKAYDEHTNKKPDALNEYSEYNVLIHEAELRNDFNLSIRYLYLQSLKKLADSELILFSADKTNNLYVQELAGRSHQKRFAFLTLNYEYVWYGRFTIDIIRYQKLKEEFILFNKKI
jgi:hypothetical protein